MSKTLFIFIHSTQVDTYVNVLAHCVTKENVQQIYFIGRKGPADKDFELFDTIHQIYERLLVLAKQEEDENRSPTYYAFVLNVFPKDVTIKDRIIRIDYNHPQEGIPIIKRRCLDTDNLIVDITGCGKRLASDIIASHIANGIKHVCYFELADKVHTSDEWKNPNPKRTKLIHDLTGDLKGGLSYYEYEDFSAPGTTIASFNKLRAQGRLIKFLLLVSVVLGVLVVILIDSEQTTYAQIAAIILAITTGLGFVEDSFSFSERFAK